MTVSFPDPLRCSFGMLGLSSALEAPTGPSGEMGFPMAGYPLSLLLGRGISIWSKRLSGLQVSRGMLLLPSDPSQPLSSLVVEGNIKLSGRKLPVLALNISGIMVLDSPDIVRGTCVYGGGMHLSGALFVARLGVGNAGSGDAFFYWV